MGGQRRPWARAAKMGPATRLDSLSGHQSPHPLWETTSPCPGGRLNSICVMCLKYRFLGPILEMGDSGLQPGWRVLGERLRKSRLLSRGYWPLW